MEYLWIVMTCFAAFFQAIRTAAQKDLNQRLSNLATTYVRSLFGLPLLIIYLALVLLVRGGGVPALSGRYLLFVFIGAATQVLATMLLIYMFRLRNYIIGTMLTRIDIITTAALGALLFAEPLSAAGMSAIAVVLTGAVLLSAGRLQASGTDLGSMSLATFLSGRTFYVALACAIAFSFSFLFLREATLAIGPADFVWRAAWTVVICVAMQVVLVGIWLYLQEPQSLAKIWPEWRLSGFVGITSALGSICWFTAFALQNAAYVRAVGQIEVAFTLLISWYYFSERITRLEMAGIIVTVLGVMIFRFAA